MREKFAENKLDYDDNDKVKNPNRYWNDPEGTYGLFFSIDTYPGTDDNNGQSNNFFPLTLPGLT
jgi:hypothetical protein